MVYHLKQDYCSIICSKRYSMCQKKVSCVSVLEKGLLPFLHESFTTKFHNKDHRFMQDNNPKHVRITLCYDIYGAAWV